MRRFLHAWVLVALTASVGLVGGGTCDVPLPGDVPTDLTGVDAAFVKLQVRNLSGLPVSVEEIYANSDEQVRLTQRNLPAAGPSSVAEGVWTLTKTITVRAKVGPTAPVTPESLVQIGDLLAARVFRFGQEFSGGETLVFEIAAPQTPVGDIIDCNGNGVNDLLDLSTGLSDDCDGDLVPDECQNDSDSDSLIDPCDGCPTNAAKHAPGICGCASAETPDDDGDGQLDCIDPCTDSDSDGFGDPGYPANTCPEDGCPDDPQKSDPGICGCGVPDSGDADSDGLLDCVDACPNDPANDADSDGVCDDVDICLGGNDADDADNDRIPDYCDACPNDDANDADGDGVCGDHDLCPDTLDDESVNEDGCSCSQQSCDDDDSCTTDSCDAGVCTHDDDDDDDGVTNCDDLCPNTPVYDEVNEDGCSICQLGCDHPNPNTNDPCPASDTIPPMFTNCPTEPIILHAEPGACTATFQLPALEASDNCGSLSLCESESGPVPPSPGCIECDHAGGSFPVGTTHVTCTAQDAAGNTATCGFDVVVQPTNEIRAVVRLIGVDAGDGMTRCIKFTPLCGDTPQTPVNQPVEFTGAPATGTAVLSLPCQDGCYTCLCAKDEQHTFPDTQGLVIVGDHFETLASLDLYGGDNDNDGGLDSNDVTLLVAQIGHSAIDAGCPATDVGLFGANRDADFDLSGTIDVPGDYAFFTQAMAHFNDGVFPIQPIACGCAPAQESAALRSPSNGPRLVIPISELDPAIAANVDLNSDEYFDYQDVEIYEAQNALPVELSTAIRVATLNQDD